MKKIYLIASRVMPILFWALLIITSIFMLVELAPKHSGWPHWDKVQHATVFMLLTLIGALVFKHKVIWLVMGLTTYGVATELLQNKFTITRLASINDWLADIAGIVIGLLIFALLQKITHKLTNKQ